MPATALTDEQTKRLDELIAKKRRTAYERGELAALSRSADYQRQEAARRAHMQDSARKGKQPVRGQKPRKQRFKGGR